MADHSVSIIGDFNEDVSAVCPNTPGGLSVEDFIEAKPLKTAFCQQMTLDQYESQGSTETEKAIHDLICFMEKDPTVMKKVLEKKKKEDIDKKGIVSYLKSRILSKIAGDSCSISSKECEERVEEIANGMIMVYNYSQESNGRRFSKRLANKRLHQYGSMVDFQSSPKKLASDHQVFYKGQSSQPCLSSIPLTDKTNILASSVLDVNELKRKPINKRESSHSTPLRAVHKELLSSNPLQRLKSSEIPRSPGRTPMRALNSSTDSFQWMNPFTPEPLSNALFRILEKKFENIRSPSTSSNDSIHSDFSV